MNVWFVYFIAKAKYLFVAFFNINKISEFNTWTITSSEIRFAFKSIVLQSIFHEDSFFDMSDAYSQTTRGT